MKVLALLLCAVVAVQGRYAGAPSRTEVSGGEAPWVVHLRVAYSTSGYLGSAVASLVSDRYALSAAEPLTNSRFIWLRYGAEYVLRPRLVTEASLVSSQDQLALININRNVETTDFIAPVGLVGASLPSSGLLYAYGELDGNLPGERLVRFAIELSQQEDGSILATSEEGKATKFDLGSPLVSEGVQLGVLVKAGDEESAAVYAPVAEYLDWIQEETGIQLCPDEEDEDKEEEEQVGRVNFVN